MPSVFNNALDYFNSLNQQSLSQVLKVKKVVDFILKQNVSNSYKSTLITKIKQHLIANNLIDSSKYFDDIEEIKDLYNGLFEQVKENRSNKSPVSLNQNDINILFNLKNSDNPWKLYIWLLFVSGRRLNELFNNTITKISIDKIKLAFISKKENKPDENIVYLIVPYDEFIAVYNKFQDYKKNMKQLNNFPYYQKAINRTLDKLKLSDSDVTTHTLRKTYLTYMVEVKKFRPDLMPSVRAKMLLCHDNEFTSTFYNGAVKLNGVNDIAKNTDKYNCMKISDIKQILKDNGIKYHSKLKKAELIALIPV